LPVSVDFRMSKLPHADDSAWHSFELTELFERLEAAGDGLTPDTLTGCDTFNRVRN